MRIHQLTFGMLMGDAVSNNILATDDRLKRWGFETGIYAQHVAAQLQDRVLPDTHFLPHLDSANDLLLFHYSIYSPNIRLFKAFRGRKILIYHNITPAEFFTAWDAQQAALCDMGRQALQTMTDCDLAIGDSDYNRQELVEAGFDAAKTAVLPLFLTLPKPDRTSPSPAPDPQKKVTWLSVGRVVPNKAMADVLRIFAVYHHTINQNSQLILVGSRGLTKYVQALDQLTLDLNLQDSVRTIGHVNDPKEMQRFFETADLYLTASFHEGFCVPLLESMAYGLPILTRRSSAIPETLGGAGVMFTELGYEAAAEMGHILVSDTAVRQQIIQKQYARLEELDAAKSEAGLKAVLEQVGIVIGKP